MSTDNMPSGKPGQSIVIGLVLIIASLVIYFTQHR